MIVLWPVSLKKTKKYFSENYSTPSNIMSRLFLVMPVVFMVATLTAKK